MEREESASRESAVPSAGFATFFAYNSYHKPGSPENVKRSTRAISPSHGTGMEPGAAANVCAHTWTCLRKVNEQHRLPFAGPGMRTTLLTNRYLISARVKKSCELLM